MLLIERLSNLWLYICRQIKLDVTHMSITEFVLNFIILALNTDEYFASGAEKKPNLKLIEKKFV